VLFSAYNAQRLADTLAARALEWIGMTKAHVGSIHIIESLSDPGAASKTGTRLFDVLEPIARQRSPITVHLHHAVGKSDFLRCLESILEQSVAENRVPLLHIEAHGAFPAPNVKTSDGLCLESHEFVSWRELVPLLTTINRVSRLNLVVFAAACFGADLASVITPRDRAPVRLILGPNRALSIRKVEQATTTFYRELFNTFNLNKALTAMNTAVEPNEAYCWGLSAEWLFQEILRGYYKFRREQSDAELDARMEELAQSYPLNGIAAQNFRHIYRDRIRDPKWLFEESYRQFFFLDTQPENAERFPVTLEECLASA
jgi:hypothetical protein